MVFTIVTIIFLPMSFIAAFFAINFQDWGNHLTIGYVTKYMFGIGLAISLVFISMAFLVHDISDAWKTLVRATKDYGGRLSRRKSSREDNEDLMDDMSTRAVRDNKPGTAGAASTAHRPQLDDVDWKGRVLDGPDRYTLRMSRDQDRYDHARLGLSPLRHGSRKLSIGSGHGVSMVRRSLDARRGRRSDDLERGMDPSKIR